MSRTEPSYVSEATYLSHRARQDTDNRGELGRQASLIEEGNSQLTATFNDKRSSLNGNLSRKIGELSNEVGRDKKDVQSLKNEVKNKNIEVCEQSEAWISDDGDDAFSHTKIILKNDDEQYFYATSPRRFRASTDVNVAELELCLIPASDIWPQFPNHFTQLPQPLPENCYLKQPNLLRYGDTKASTDMANIVLHEAHVCEILRQSPHPNIAQYLGCLVGGGRIKGLGFVKYDMTLQERVARGSRPINVEDVLQGIKEGLQHLHGLDLIHCDINPSNIFMKGEIPVIGDFDSCRGKGEKLGLKAGTHGWTSEKFELALPENDHLGISKIQEFLLSHFNR